MEQDTAAARVPLTLSGRTTHFPLRVRVQRHVESLLSLAAALEARDDAAIAAWDDDLDRAAAIHEVSMDAPAGAVSPTLRAKALAAVLVDLSRSGWEVSVDDRQVYVSAPRWSAGGDGLSEDLVRAEKARARHAMAARVQEEIESESTRRFILRLESARATEAGPRSVLSLLADGPRLAASLRDHGPSAVRPYLQRADGDAGRDPHTGLAYVEVFRYFRLFWSFPTSAPPGRSVSYLVRDAGQPGHPVCALVCVASPVPRLSARDSALGWTAPWLEAIVRALEIPERDLEEHFRSAEERWRTTTTDASGASIIADVSCLLGLETTRDARALARALAVLSGMERAERADHARRRILTDLRAEVTTALDQISFDGFGFDAAFALARPLKAAERLERLRFAASARWRESRRVRADALSSPRLDADAFANDEELRVAARDPLFFKKRVAQAARALRAWSEIMPVSRERTADRLRALVRPGSRGRTTAVPRGLRVALLLRQNRLVASQVLDVCVCGAIPPYGPLLVGKLAALAALSRDVAADYHGRYAGRASEITSQMAGRAIERSADVVTLTTTSFFGVGSSQYERLTLEHQGSWEVRWRRVGYTRGNGTLHFSRRTSELMDRLLSVETGARLITSRFGEGPSERLRKIRDGLELLGVNAGELLRHGMPRLVYVAELAPGATRPGAQRPGPAWRRVGPSFADVASAWRERWLASRLQHAPGVLTDVEAFDRVEALLSARLRHRNRGMR